ncbi:hypothetical protein LEM8419_00544 [Neolewinella maritima]|uniref:histidine kinase n=1 Tax=Neolewinella maritima TaxID=1383882 RepID=A0ABM9AXL2_9BACT|nr:sensor histidine kinase [Neolewinella maritima]CAH0999247.1 hypothetical protein LEM8419_00544 [Neolewinella maritima]
MRLRYFLLWVIVGMTVSADAQHERVADSLLGRADSYIFVQLDTFQRLSRQAVREARLGSDSFLLAESYEFLGNYYAEMGARDSVIHYLELARGLYVKDSSRFAGYYALSIEATVAQARGDDPAALRSSFALMEECERTDDQLCLADAYWQIGSVFYYQDLQEDAVKYSQEALRLLAEDTDTLFYASCLIEYSESLRRLDDLPAARQSLILARDLLADYDVPVLLAELYLHAGANHLQEELLDLADQSLGLSLRLAQQTGAHLTEALALGYTGRVYLQRRDFPAAIAYLRRSLVQSERIADRTYLIEQQRYLAEAYAAEGRYDSAFYYSSVAERNYRLSVQQDHDEQIASLQVSFETAEKERKIEEQRTELRGQRKQLYGVIGVAILLLTLGLLLTVLARRLRRRGNENLQLVAQKETLINEIHHRVKNNLQVISSLLQLQIRGLQAGDDRARMALLESQARVEAMGLIHQRLYQEGRDFNQVQVADYLRELGTSLVDTYRLHQRVRLDFDIEDTTLDVDLAISLGLIVNELISNSLKHAFPDGGSGTITIRLYRLNKDLVLQVSDDGPARSTSVRQHQEYSFGTKLIDLLSRKLNGSIDTSITDSYRTEIRFPHTSL